MPLASGNCLFSACERPPHQRWTRSPDASLAQGGDGRIDCRFSTSHDRQTLCHLRSHCLLVQCHLTLPFAYRFWDP